MTHGFLKIKGAVATFANKPIHSPPQEWGGAGGGVEGLDFEEALTHDIRRLTFRV